MADQNVTPEADTAQLRLELDTEREKTAALVACLFDVVGVDRNDIRTEREYLDGVLRTVSSDLDVLAVALGSWVTEDAEIGDLVARWALRVEGARRAARLVAASLED